MLLDPARLADDTRFLVDDSSYVLVTGATGFVGQYLLRDLTNAGFRVAVIVRPNQHQTGIERIEAILQRWESIHNEQLPRPVILEGCITETNVGLSPEDLQWVKTHVGSILHNAAILKFNGDRESEPWVTNVGGTENVLALAKRCGIDNFHYVSTAYACGIQDSLVTEDMLDNGQEFRNDYERSKFEAELKVRGSGIKNVTVFRPAVIVGDSRTGFTCSYHGLFVYLRLMALLIPHQQRDENGVALTPIQLPMTGNEQRNLVPVDWVSEVITKLISNRQAYGRTFHLTPEKTVTPREIIDSCYRYFNSTGVEYVGPAENLDQQQSEFGATFLQNTGMYHAYDANDPLFDADNLRRFAGDIRCPHIDEQTVHRFLDYGQQDHWGKRKPKQSPVRFWLHEHLPEISRAVQSYLTQHKSLTVNRPVVIGLNVRGAGGGHWTIHCENGRVTFCKGILAAIETVIEFSSAELQRSFHDAAENWEPLVHRWLQEIWPANFSIKSQVA